jgi:hypothetical protein
MERDKLLEHLGLGHKLPKISAAAMSPIGSNNLRGASTEQVTGHVTEHVGMLLWVFMGRLNRTKRMDPMDMAAGYLDRLIPDKPANFREKDIPKLSKQADLKTFIQQ